MSEPAFQMTAGERAHLGPLLVVLGLLLLLGYAQFLLAGNCITDDAFIFLRYADHFLAGHGIAWNIGGERVDGLTSPLYFALVLLPRAAGIEPVLGLHLLNRVLFLLTLALVPLLFASALRGPLRATLAATALVACSTDLALAARTGMETQLFALLLVAALLAHLNARSVRGALGSGLLFGALLLARPDGSLVVLVWLADSLRTQRREGHGDEVDLRSGQRRARLSRGLFMQLAGLALVLAPWLLWHRAYFGDWLPNTFAAKVEGVPLVWALERGLPGIQFFFAHQAGEVIAAALGLACLLRRDRLAGLLAAAIVLWLGYLVAIGLDDWSLWYCDPPLFLAVLLGARALAGLLCGQSVAPGSKWPIASLLVGLALLLLCGRDTAPDAPRIVMALVLIATSLGFLLRGRIARLQPWVRCLSIAASISFALLVGWHGLAIAARGAPDRFELMRPGNRAVMGFISIGKALGAIAAPGDSLAIGAAGAIPYYSGLTAYDTLGINDRHIAHTAPKRESFAHDKGDGAYILSLRPTFLVPIPFRTPLPYAGVHMPGSPFVEKSFEEIAADPRFAADYEPQRLELPDGGYFNFFRRKP